jgi:hypothetical protein
MRSSFSPSTADECGLKNLKPAAPTSLSRRRLPRAILLPQQNNHASAGDSHHQEMSMHKSFRLAAIAAALTLGFGTAALAADAADPAVGTWNLNAAKSKSSAIPKSQTRTYVQTADGLALTVKGVAADGSAVAQKSTFKYDGKAYAFSGGGFFDSIKLTQADPHTVTSTQWKDGKQVGTTSRTISSDGKTLTLTSDHKDAKGANVHDVLVFDKQ